MARRFSSVVEGRNGAMIHSSPSATSPSGAMCTVPAALTVVTMISRIIGMSASGLREQRMPSRLEPRALLKRWIGGAAPVERLILRVALPQPPGNFCLHQLGPEIECMSAVALDAELVEQRERVLPNMVTRAAIDVDPVLGSLDAEIGIGDLCGDLGDLLRRVGKRFLVVHLQQRVAVVLRQA